MKLFKNLSLRSLKKLTIKQTFPFILIIMSIVGFVAALTLTLEELATYKNPDHQLSCSINPIVACGPVMKSTEAHAFGFPNPYIGLAAFSIILTVAVSMLAGAKMKDWYWRTFQLGASLGLLFVIWLIYGSVYQIGALCLYCMATWVVVSVIFWYLLQWNLETGVIKLKPRYQRFIRKYHGEILISWFLLVTAVILNHFWYYFKTVL